MFPGNQAEQNYWKQTNRTTIKSELETGVEFVNFRVFDRGVVQESIFPHIQDVFHTHILVQEQHKVHSSLHSTVRMSAAMQKTENNVVASGN